MTTPSNSIKSFCNQFVPIFEKGDGPCSSSTVKSVSLFALQAFLFIGIPAMLIAGFHFHVYSFPTALECAAAYFTVSQVVRVCYNGYLKGNEKKTHEPVLKKILESDGRGISMEKATTTLTFFWKDLAKDAESLLKRDNPASKFKDLILNRQHVEKPNPQYISDTNSYDAHFEGSEKSSYFQIGPGDPNIGLINGVGNTVGDVALTALATSFLLGIKSLRVVHNATHGLSTDLHECEMGYKGVLTAPVWHLHQVWDEYFDAHEQDDFIMICHSQGALHTYNALHTYDEKRRKRIHVVAVAPAKMIEPEICKSVHHFITATDPVPKKGGVDPKRSDIVTTVKAIGWFDHELLSLSYAGPVQNYVGKLIPTTRIQGNA